MAKTLTSHETNNMPVSGKWIWKEETQCLEYIGNYPSSDKHDKKKDKKKGHHDNRGRTSPTQLKGGGFIGAPGANVGKGIPRNRARSAKHTEVTLEDVKIAALKCMDDNKKTSSDTFMRLYDTRQFDEFLLYLINYFHWYDEKKSHEEKPNPMNIEPSLRELKYYEDLCQEMDKAQKKLGRFYCILVLGIGMENQHHMKGGISRVSNTYQDRNMYETLYHYCTYLVWIAFRKKCYETVEKELNRILRSQTFNPAIRIKNAPETKQVGISMEEDGEEEVKPKQEEKKLTPAEYRRKQGRRPPIKNIVNQRSPALVSLLPSPKEEADWLFKRTGALSPKSLAEKDREDLDEEIKSKFGHLHDDIDSLHKGIIGEPLNHFKPETLTPIGADPEGEEEEEGEQKTQEGRQGSQTALRTPGSQAERKQSRDATAVSSLTQEGLPDE